MRGPSVIAFLLVFPLLGCAAPREWPTVAQLIATIAPAQSPEVEVVTKVTPSVVLVITPSGSGTGVKIDRGILTNDHVVRGATQIEILTSTGQREKATVSRSDPKRDLALLLTESPLPSVPLATQTRQGEAVLVLGYPRSNILGGQATLTRGLVSATRDDKANDRTLIQTDAALNPGNSGGPILNMQGKLVGLVVSQLKDSEGLGFGVSSETVQAFLTGPAQTGQTVATYTVNPSEVVLRMTDLPGGEVVWTVRKQAGAMSNSMAVLSAEWAGRGEVGPSGLKSVFALVDIRPSAEEAQREVDKSGIVETDSGPDDFRRSYKKNLSPPRLGDMSRRTIDVFALAPQPRSTSPGFGYAFYTTYIADKNVVVMLGLTGNLPDTSWPDVSDALCKVMLARLH